MRIQFSIYILGLICPMMGLSQLDSLNAVSLSEANVLSESFEYSGFTHESLDSDSLIANGNFDLNEALQGVAGLWVASYGLSGASSPAIRGASANHTNVFWNGIQINSVTLGQADLRTIRLNTHQELHVKYGLASLADGSGGLGGSIHLNDKIGNKNSAVIGLGYGSFSAQQISAGINIKLKNWRSKTSFSYEDAKNDFAFENNSTAERLTEKREDEQLRAASISQTFSRVFGTRSKLSFHTMYSSLERGVADPITTAQTEGKLNDDQLRALVNYKYYGVYFHEVQAYVGSETNRYDQHVRSEVSVISKAFNYKVSRKIGKAIDAYFTSENTLSNVSSSGFGKVNALRNSISLGASIHKKSSRYSVLLREEIFEGNHSNLMISGSAEYKASKKLTLTASAGRTYRFPTLNDLYWTPGGNRNLKAEEGLSAEASGKVNLNKSSVHLTTYFNQNTNLIQWIPGADFWFPVNVNKARTYGVELRLNKTLVNREAFKANLSIGSAYNKALKLDEGVYEPLIYRPDVINNTALEVKSDKWFAKINHTFTSSRLYSSSSEKSLAPYHLLNGTLGIKLPTSKTNSLRLSFTINNILNSSYEVVRWYPMPGTNFRIALNFKFL